jgi:hypothetical protein
MGTGAHGFRLAFVNSQCFVVLLDCGRYAVLYQRHADSKEHLADQSGFKVSSHSYFTMPKYRGTFSVDTNFFGRLDGTYHIDEYALIPCLITPTNQERGCSNFILQFDFDGLDEKGIQDSSEQTRNFFENLGTGTQIAKTFISWFVTCTRACARLSSDSYGSMMRQGPSDHVLLEDYDEQKLDTIFHVDNNAKMGEFVHVERPNFGDIRNVSPTLKLPSDFSTLTRKLFSLRAGEKNKFLNACFAYQFALENWGAYPTVSIVALVSSVESIMADEYSSGFCDAVQQACPLKWDVMKKFRKFFENNLQYPLPKELEGFLNEAYSDRSAYVHKSLLGEQEIRGIFQFHHNEKGSKVKNEQESLERLVNAGLIAWLKRI